MENDEGTGGNTRGDVVRVPVSRQDNELGRSVCSYAEADKLR